MTLTFPEMVAAGGTTEASNWKPPDERAPSNVKLPSVMSAPVNAAVPPNVVPPLTSTYALLIPAPSICALPLTMTVFEDPTKVSDDAPVCLKSPLNTTVQPPLNVVCADDDENFPSYTRT